MRRSTRLAHLVALVAGCLCAFAPPVGAQAPLDLVGRWPYGPASAVAVSGDYAYFGSGAALLVADISNPASLELIGEIVLPGVVNDVVVSDGYAYVVDGESGLWVIDVSTPTAPVQVGVAGTPGTAQSVAVLDGYAYVADDIGGLRVIDVSTPSNPFEIAYLLPLYDAVTRVVVSGDYAFVVDFDDAPWVLSSSHLRVIDVSTPSAPVDVSTLFIDSYVPGIAISGSYVYALGRNAEGGGLFVVDVTDPANPSEAAYLGDVLMGSVAVAGVYAYVTDNCRGLEVIDVRDPQHPESVGIWDDLPWGHSGSGVAIAGDHAYVPAGWNGLRAVDVSTPADPVNVGFLGTPGSTVDVAVENGYAYLAAGKLRIVDVSDPSDASEVGSLALPVGAGGVNISDDGNLAYLTSELVDIRVVDVSDPYTPVELGSVVLEGWAAAADVSGGFAYVVYVSSGDLSLRVVDVTDPSIPFGVGELRQGMCQGVAVSGVYAYLACSQGLRVVDVSTPALPVQVGFADIDETCYDVAVRGEYAYVAAGIDGLRVIDVSDPSTPVEVGVLPALAYGLAVSGIDTVVLVGGDIISVINVSDPSAPFEVARSNLPGTGEALAFSDGYAFVADGQAGMEIFARLPFFADGFESGDTSAWSATVP